MSQVEVPKNDIQEQEVPVKKPHANKGKKPTEKQMENLRKGMEALKKKREEMAKEKETREKTNAELKAKGLPPVEPPVKLKKKEVVEVKPEPVEIKVEEPKQRKPRSDKGKPRIAYASGITREEYSELKELMKSTASMKQQEKVIEKPVEKIVEKVIEKPVEKTKVISGSDLLNKVFFNK